VDDLGLDTTQLPEDRSVRLVYTTPSHRREEPRWRVIAPLTNPIEPNALLPFATRLNYLLKGILAPESADALLDEHAPSVSYGGAGGSLCLRFGELFRGGFGEFAFRFCFLSRLFQASRSLSVVPLIAALVAHPVSTKADPGFLRALFLEGKHGETLSHFPSVFLHRLLLRVAHPIEGCLPRRSISAHHCDDSRETEVAPGHRPQRHAHCGCLGPQFPPSDVGHEQSQGG
jgi:hypothetical protein